MGVRGTRYEERGTRVEGRGTCGVLGVKWGGEQWDGEVASGTSSVPEVRDNGRVVDDDFWWGFLVGFCGGVLWWGLRWWI